MKRLFIALKILAPWPANLPSGRVLEEEMRHLSLLFLGEQDEKKILSLLPACLPEVGPLGPAGYFDHCLFLPPAHPTVAAWHCILAEYEEPLRQYVEKLSRFFHAEGIILHQKNHWLPHVTISRQPFVNEEWLTGFTQLPFIVTSFDLFESSSQLQYTSLWHVPLVPVFERLSHTADIAFVVRGVDLIQLYHHACIALAFEYPQLLSLIAPLPSADTLDEVVMELGKLITQADLTYGSPFKAVSYHGQAKQIGNYLEWEMIVDV